MDMKNFRHVILEESFGDLNTVYDNGQRFYETPEGQYPSVTTVTGWQKRKFFAKWRSENPKESKRVLDRGNKLHNLIEEYINNNIESTNGIDLPILDLFLWRKVLFHLSSTIFRRKW